MTSKQKKKRFQNKRKQKERRKQRRQQSYPKLAHAKYLDPFKEIIYEEYKPSNVSLYRWVHNPDVPDDFKPQIYQENSRISPDDLKVPDVNAPKKVILQYTSRFTLSHFESPDEAIKAWQESHANLLKKYKPEKRAEITGSWIKNKGQYVIKVDYTEDSGLIGPQSNGPHKEIFLFEGIDASSLIDKSFPPIKIEIQ